MFTRITPGNRLARAAAVGAVAIAIPVAAWALPAPDAPERPALELRAAGSGTIAGLDAITVRPEPADTPVVHPQTGRDIRGEPMFTPYNVSPELRNRDEFREVLQRRYPADLRDAGIGGTVLLHVLVDDEGVVRETRVMQGSGQEALDHAAGDVMREARFSPARLDDVRVPVWIQLPVTFRTDGGAATEQRRETPRTAPRRETLPPPPPIEGERAPEDRPTFTPFTQAPELRNREEFQQTLRTAYPDEMREAGIGGTILLHVFIDTEGRVANTRVMESSGYPQLDRAAEEVMREARFAPARNRDEVVPVWVQLPVTFRTDARRDATEEYAYRIQVSDEGITAQCEYGCAWKELSAGYSGRYRLSSAGVGPGVGRAEGGNNATFQHLLTVSGSGVSATCEAGCRWRTANASSPQGRYRISHGGIETLR